MSTTSVVVPPPPTQGEVMECEDQGVEIPVVFLTSSEIDEDVVQESGPVEKQATTKNTKEGGNDGSESLRSLEEHTKVNRQSKQASKYSTRLNHAKTSGTRLSLLVASASANMKKRSEPSATTKNSAHDQPEDSVVKDSQKNFTTKAILMSLLAETPRRIKKRKSKRIEDRILADDLSEELTSSIIEDRSVRSKKATKSRLLLLLTTITPGTRRGDAPSDEKSFDDSTIDTALLTDDRSVSSKLSNLVAEHEGEAEQEMNELIDVVLSEFSDQEIVTGLKEQMKSVTLAKRAQVYLRTRAEHTLTAIVDEIDSSEIQQAIKSPDAWNDLVGCGAMPHPELLVDNCGAVASIICLNDYDSTKNFHDDDTTLQLPTDGDGLFIDNDSFSDLPLFLDDDDNSSMGDTVEGDPLQDDTLHDALREHNFAKAMECLKKRAVRTGLSEVTLLDAVRAKQASSAREARPPPRRSPRG